MDVTIATEPKKRERKSKNKIYRQKSKPYIYCDFIRLNELKEEEEEVCIYKRNFLSLCVCEFFCSFEWVQMCEKSESKTKK